MSKPRLEQDIYDELDDNTRRIELLEKRNAQVSGGGSGGGGLTNGSVFDIHVNSGAAIQLSKLAVNPTLRSTHTGTQLAATISDFDTQVRTNRLDQLATPFAALAMGNQKVINLGDPTAASDAATKSYVDARAGSTAILDNVPVGTILAHGGAAPPTTDWLLCDGSSYLRDDYLDLFDALGGATSPWGLPDGTHFNVPDLKGRSPVGAGTGSGLSAKNRGTKIGYEPSNMPNHDHGGGSHTHTLNLYLFVDPYYGGGGFGGSAPYISASNGWTGSGSAHPPYLSSNDFSGAIITPQGSGSATDGNVPPSTVVTFVVKAKATKPSGILASTEAAPVGTITPFGGAAAPDANWGICDGSAISRAAYPELFTAIGTTYNIGGEAGTDFRLPDLRGRTVLGVGTATGAAGATAHTLGQKGGEETHVLTVAELASHSHTYWSPQQFAQTNAGFPAIPYLPGGAGLGPITPATGGAGSDIAHNNLSPYVGVNYIIRLKPAQIQKFVVAADLSPIGSVTAYAGASLPAGWLPCDGASLLRVDYPELFAAIDTAWGSVDGLHFSVPDLRGRTVIGAGTGIYAGATARALAAIGGEEKHTLTIGEMPSHTHVMQMAHNIASSPWDVGIPAQGSSQNAGVVNSATDPAGGGASHNVMQPFAACNYMIKAKMQNSNVSTTGTSGKSVLPFTGDGATSSFILKHTLNLMANEPFVGMVWEADGTGNPTRQAVADVLYNDFKTVKVNFATAPVVGKKYILTVIG